MENKIYYALVSYSIYNGKPETAYAYSIPEKREEENTEKYFRKIFSGTDEKKVLKEAEAYAKAHNKILREKSKAAKAEKLAAKEAKKAEKVTKKDSEEARIKSFISPEIKKIIGELFEKQKANVLENLKGKYAYVVTNLKSIEGLDPKDDKYKIVIGNYRNPTFAYQISNRIMEHKKSKDSEKEIYYKPELPLFFKSDYKKIVEKMIQSDLEAITGSFLYKMEYKLGEVIKGKKIKNFDSQGMHQGSVIIAFEDGTSFEMVNSIEIGVSKNQVVFNRFPTRFHNVTFRGGKFVKWESEENMKKEF